MNLKYTNNFFQKLNKTYTSPFHSPLTVLLLKQVEFM